MTFILLAALASPLWVPPDLTHTDVAASARAELEAIVREKGGLGVVAHPLDQNSPWTVTDYGNISVIRDVEGDFFGSGQDMFRVTDGSLQAVDAFYDAHPDADPQFVVVILDWLVQTGGAFYLPVANDVAGIGSVNGPGGPDVFDTDFTTALEGVVWLNGIGLYTTPGLQDFFAGLLFGQEFGHRWLSFVQFIDAGGNPRTDLLGRQDAHWSYYLDSDWSWVEGNDWTDNGDGTFTTANDTFDSVLHYSDLDLYLMGLIPSTDVAPMTLITAVGGPSPADAPAAWFSGNPVTVAGTSETVTIDMIVNAEGVRNPDVTASQKDFNLQVIYLLRRGDRFTAAAEVELAEVLERFTTLWEQDVRGLATVQFTAHGTANTAPDVVISVPNDGNAKKPVRFDASGSTDPEGYELTYIWSFGNGNETTTTDPVIEYAYEESGIYTISLRVVDAAGAEAFASDAISIGGPGCACAVAPQRPKTASLLSALLLASLVFRARRRVARSSRSGS